MQNKNDFLFDKRIVSRNISSGKTSQAEYKKTLSELLDLEDHCEKFTAESLGPDGKNRVELENVESDAT